MDNWVRLAVGVEVRRDAGGVAAVTLQRRRQHGRVEAVDEDAAAVDVERRQRIVLEGDYETGKERDGRKKALEKLTTNIVDGAQSQW